MKALLLAVALIGVTAKGADPILYDFYVIAPSSNVALGTGAKRTPVGKLCTAAYEMIIGDGMSLWHCQGYIIPAGAWQAGKATAPQQAALTAFIESLHRYGGAP